MSTLAGARGGRFQRVNQKLCDLLGYTREELRTARPDLPVLFISGYAADVIVERGLLGPGVDFLRKPFSTLDLARKVRQLLDRV